MIDLAEIGISIDVNQSEKCNYNPAVEGISAYKKIKFWLLLN